VVAYISGSVMTNIVSSVALIGFSNKLNRIEISLTYPC